MDIEKVTQTNQRVYQNLVQAYEAEFSAITGKVPNAQGLFALDTHLDNNNTGFLIYLEGVPAGLAVVTLHGHQRYEIAEFYTVPCFRQRGLGQSFAHRLWDTFRGHWQIKQIRGAEYASVFWNKTIDAYHASEYSEDVYEDPYWGVVTRQRFCNM